MEEELTPLEGPVIQPEETGPTSIEEMVPLETQPQNLDIESPLPDLGVDEEMGFVEAYADVFNPFAVPYFDEELRGVKPEEAKRDWIPEEDPWFKEQAPDDKLLIYDAPTKEYAAIKLERKKRYDMASQQIADDSLLVQIPMGFATSLFSPTTLIPGGFVFKQAKTAYTIGPKLSHLAQISATSGLAAVAANTIDTRLEEALGTNPDADYLQGNAWAMGIGAGLPIFGKVIGSSYNIGKTAKMLASSPGEFAVLSGEIALSKVPQAKTLYNKIAPDWMKSDVMITSESNNPYTTMISMRMDSPSVALVDRETGAPVPKMNTGQDKKISIFGKMNLWKSDMNSAYKEAQTGGFVGSKDDFQIEVNKVLRLRANRQDMEADAYVTDTMTKELQATTNNIRQAELEEVTAMKAEGKEVGPMKTDDEVTAEANEALKGRYRQLKDEAYSRFNRPIEVDNIGLQKAAQISDDYFTKMREEGVALKSQEMARINKDKNYITRIFDYGKIRDLDETLLAKRLGESIGSHPGNIGIDPIQAGKDMANKLKSLDYSREYADYSFFVPQEVGLTGYLKERKYKIDESMLMDILIDNIEDTVGQYTYKQAGHYSALHSFPEIADVPLAKQAQAFREKYIEPKKAHDMTVAEKMSPKDRNNYLHKQGQENKALENMFEDLLGTYRINKNGESAGWKFARLTNMWNSLTFGGGFALNTAAETGSLLLQGNFTNVMKTNMGQLREIGTLFNGKGIEDPFVRDMVLAGNMESLFEYKGMMRMADTEGVFNADKLEHGLQKTNEAWYKWNGLRPATAALEAFTAPKVLHDIMDFGKAGSISLSNEKYLARIGLSKSDAVEINKLLLQHGEFKNGGITDINAEAWDNDEMLDKLLNGITTGVRHTVIKGDTTYLPSYMIDPNTPMAPFVRLITNFLRYPIAANETLLARGLEESTAKFVAATVTSAMMMGTVLYMREQAAVAAGLTEEADTKYSNFLDDEDQMLRLVQDTMLKVGTLGGTTIAYEHLLNLGGFSKQGTEYVPNSMEGAGGATFSRLSSMQDIMSALTSGEYADKSMWYGIKGMIPFATYPGINEASGYLIRKHTD